MNGAECSTITTTSTLFFLIHLGSVLRIVTLLLPKTIQFCVSVGKAAEASAHRLPKGATIYNPTQGSRASPVGKKC